MRPRRRQALPALALVVAFLTGCTAGRGLSRARQADQLGDYDTAVAAYASVVRQNPSDREAQLGLERAKLRASEAHLLRGRRLLATGRYEDAVLELQIAADLNPTSGDAERQLRAARAALREPLAAPPEGETALETLLARTPDISAEGHTLPDIRLPGQVLTTSEATTRQLYLVIARLANLNVVFDPSLPEEPAPATFLSDLTVEDALDAIARSTKTFYQVTAPSTIIIVPDTPDKRLEYGREAERVFFLRNADLEETVNALRVVSDVRSISQISGINAIVLRDSPERLEVAGRLLNAFDKARAELVVDVEILEVDRTKLMEYGLQLASGASPGIAGLAAVDETNLTVRRLGSLSPADIFLSGVPALYYRLLKTDARTRTLANPHLRISDGVTAAAQFGEEVPTPTATIGAVATGGVGTIPITQYSYRNIGVNIQITPRVHPNDEVSLSLNVELSNLQGAGFGGLPTFGTRRVTTTLRLKDGETNILGGLIRDDERFERGGLPGLSDLPVLQHLFGRTRRESVETDVVIMLTPHIVRGLDVSEEDLRPLTLPREGPGRIDSGLDVPIVRSPPPPPQPAGPEEEEGDR
jgi:general secretion pathway protein D